MISKKSAGITFVEVMIAVAILSGVMFLGNVGIKMLNMFNRQQKYAETELEAQHVMYLIERDIRNSLDYAIVPSNPALPSNGGNEISMSLQEFGDYDQNLKAILDAATASVTYNLVTVGGKTFLKRKLSKGGTEVDNRLLVNVLDVSASAIFKPIPGYEGVAISLTLAPSFSKKSKKTYSVSVLKWFNYRNTAS